METTVKKRAFLAFLLMGALILTWGCGEERDSAEEPTAGEASRPRVAIVLQEGEAFSSLADRIAYHLEKKGLDAFTYFGEEDIGDEADAVIFVDEKYRENDSSAGIFCYSRVTDPRAAEMEGAVCPYLSSGSIARAAMLLLPNAQHFFIISRAEGAADVQAACDIFDAAGVDYTVELLGDRSAGEAVLSSAKRGADAVILPFFAPDAGAMSPSELGTGLITVGLDGAVEGALATFCPDIEAIAKRAADEAALAVNGEGAVKRNESLVCIRIDPRIAEALSADVTAAEEDYKTAYMCEG